MPEYFGVAEGKGKEIGIIVSRFNQVVTSNLLRGAVEMLLEHGVKKESIHIFWVPGAFEIPHLLKRLLDSERFDGIITLGCIIRGDTPHFDFIAGEVTRGIGRLTLQYKTPIAFGILTAESLDQAMERAGGKLGNRGREVALSLLQVMGLLNKIKETNF